MARLPVWTPYCGPAPDPTEALGRWNGDPWLWAALVAGGALAWLLLKRRDERAASLAGIGVLAVVFVSPLCALSSALFTARTLHHLLLVLAVAPLLALALPVGTRARPMIATAAQAAIFWAWHAPGAYAAALSSDAVYWLMQLSILGSGVWFWRELRGAAAPVAIAALLAAMLAMGLLGALLVFAGQPVYAPHFATTLAWGLTPLEDQQAAGLIMWAPAAGAYLVAALWRLARLLTPGEARAA